MDDIFSVKMKEYEKVFNDIFPNAELNFSDEGVIKAIDKCLELNKPAEEVFNIKYDSDHIY